MQASLTFGGGTSQPSFHPSSSSQPSTSRPTARRRARNLNVFGNDANAMVTVLADTISNAISVGLKGSQKLIAATITYVNGIPASQVSSSVSPINVDYEVTLEQICETESCSETDNIASSFLEQVKGSMNDQIANGALTASLVAKALELGVSSLLGVAGEWHE